MSKDREPKRIRMSRRNFLATVGIGGAAALGERLLRPFAALAAAESPVTDPSAPAAPNTASEITTAPQDQKDKPPASPEKQYPPYPPVYQFGTSGDEGWAVGPQTVYPENLPGVCHLPYGAYGNAPIPGRTWVDDNTALRMGAPWGAYYSGPPQW